MQMWKTAYLSKLILIKIFSISVVGQSSKMGVF